jgi:hypothetical protein
MRFTGVDFKKPANSMLAAIQNYCFGLVKAPDENGINDLDMLEHKVAAFIEEQRPYYPKCRSEVTSELHSYQSFQVFNVIQGEDKIFIQLCSRRTEYEKPFEEYDNVRISYRWPAAVN